MQAFLRGNVAVPISFTCKSCGRPIRVQDSLAGRAAKCPGCGNRVRIPDDDPLGPLEELGGAHEYDDDYGELSSEAGTYPVSGGMFSDGERGNPYATSSGRRLAECPSCGESIRSSASRCRYCGEYLDGGTARHRDDALQISDWVLAILCPLVGCIVGLTYLLMGRRKGLTMMGVCFLVVLILASLRAWLLAMGP